MAQTTITERDSQVAAEVRAELGRQELSIAGLARMLGEPEWFIRRRLKGQVPFSAIELQRVADVLEVPMDQFLEAS